MERINWLLEGLTSAGPAVAASVLFVSFGVAVAWLMGLRNPLLLIVAALPAAIGGVALTAQVLGTLGLATTLLVDALVVLLLAALIGAVRVLWMRRAGVAKPEAQWPPPLVWAGAALGAAASIGVWLAGIGNFAIPPQQNDDIWHGYLVERLTHMPAITASSVAPTFVDAAAPIVHYPYGLHLAAAFMHGTTGVGVAEILNGAWVVYVGLLLPFGLAALAWRLFPDRPWVAFWSGTFAASVTVFPYVTNGILPYTAALAMVPGLLAVLLAFLDQRLRVPGLVVVLAAVGLFVTHPAGALAAAILAAPIAVEHVLRRKPRDIGLAVRNLGLVAALAGLASVPWILAAGDAGVGPPTNPLVDGVIPATSMFLTLASPWTPAQPALAVLAAVGVVASVVWRRGISISAGLMIFGVLFIGVVAGVKTIADLTGPWYGNWYRLLAVVGLTVPIIAGLGLSSIVRVVRPFVTRVAMARASVAFAAVALAIGSVTMVATAYDAARGLSIVRSSWHSGLVTTQDLQLFQALAGRVGPTERVLNSPLDGSTWMYPLSGVTPVLPYASGALLSLSELLSGAGPYAESSRACQGLQQLGVTYAIAKKTRGADADYPYDIAGFVSRHPDLFTVLLQTESGAIYSIDQQALAQCANSHAVVLPTRLTTGMESLSAL